MKITLLIFGLFLVSFFEIKAQEKIKAGIELDALPYITGGYFGAGFIGKGHWRLRVLTASVNKPDWSINKNFSNNHVEAYAVVVDRFFKKSWSGWWMGGGLVYWKSKIQTQAKQQTAKFQNSFLNGSLGYNLKLNKHFYLSPWAGMSLRVGGDQNVPVDQTTYTLPMLNPEASLKLGVIF